MKPFELFQQWTQFEAMMESKSLSPESKVSCGLEWLRALPPRQLCVSSALTYDIVSEAMLGRVTDLKEMIYGNTNRTEAKEATSSEEGKEPRQSKKRPSEKPVQKNAGKRRGA